MNKMVPVAVIASALVFVGLFGKHLGLEEVVRLDPSVGGTTSQSSAGTQVRLGPLRIAGRGTETGSVVGNGGWVVLGAGYSVRSMAADPDLGLALERRSGSETWTPVVATFSHSAGGGIEVRTPPWSSARPSTAVDYRIVSHGVSDAASGGVATTSASSAVTVTYENQDFYTGIAATVWTVASRYCPTTAVHEETLSKGHAGEYRSGTQLITIDPSVERTMMTSPIDLRAIAFHECSHERQWMNYGGTNDGHVQMEAAVDRIFADWTTPAAGEVRYPVEPPTSDITPIEHAADCGAQALNPGGYLGYGGYCSQPQIDAGRRLLLGGPY